MSEAVILASINPKYDDRLFIELRVQYEKTTNSVKVSLLGVDSLWGDCTFIPANWGS